jgi:hypothetical protein
MALTQILTRVIYSGPAAPVNPPLYPNVEAVYYQLVAGGTAVLHVWDVTTQTWIVVGGSDQNWTALEACGWYGPHNETIRIAPTHTFVPVAGTWFPHFSVSLVSASDIPFQVIDLNNSNTLVCEGIFPMASLEADAGGCTLVDGLGVPVTSIAVSSGMMLACVPTGGHAAMPADGETFECSGYVVM